MPSRRPLVALAALSALSGLSLRAQELSPGRTPRAGEGFRTTLFGEPFDVQPRDRARVSAWDLGLIATPELSDGEFLPYGWLYFWQRPSDDSHYLRALVGGFQNDLVYAFHPDGARPFELIGSLNTSTPLWDSAEYVDGVRLDGEELGFGYARIGLGVGHREAVDPGNADNLFSSDVLVEPGWFWFDRGEDTSAGFVLPDDTFEVRLRWTTRYDALERNLVERAHAGVAAGLDAIWGTRTSASGYGDPSGSGSVAEGDVDDHLILSGYSVLATDVPFLESEHHRLVLTFHGGLSDGTDRFSAMRVGGFPDTRGEETGSLARPVLPGAGLDEFFPEHYAIASASYRLELSFFAYLETGATVAWLDRDRFRNGVIRRSDDTLSAAHLLLTSGFLGQTRLQMGYAYGFDLVRDGEEGAHAFTIRMSADF
ncbi:MAG: hypothetical protein IT457_21720 [Planctomycetes bacterium]|nr:hypothetical protein [Planctomycetota bacterium]